MCGSAVNDEEPGALRRPLVWMVPGAAVRSYVRPAVEVLAERQVDVHLLPAPGDPGVPADLRRYGEVIAGWLANGRAVDLLIGLSVGSQVVAAAAGVRP